MGNKNIILIMTDQQRLDFTGYSGNNKIVTPNMDVIAESVGFTCCQTVNPVCTPARAALITGRYAHQIGMVSMSGDLSLEYPTFMQALQKEGYSTSAVGKLHFLQTWPWGIPRGKGLNLAELNSETQKYGYDYVWETAGKQQLVLNYCNYCKYLEEKGMLDEVRDFMQLALPNGDYPDMNFDQVNPWPFAEEDYIDIVTADQIIARIKNHPKNSPFFIFGSFCGPHKPYDPPRRYLDRVEYVEEDDFILEKGTTMSSKDKQLLYKQRQASKAMIKLMDDQIGRIMDVLKEEDLYEETVIIFTSDHGDMLGDHFRIQKAVPWRQAVTVPLAIRHPDYLRREINNSPVEITDVAATILDVAGVDVHAALSRKWPVNNDIIPSRSLMPIIRGETSEIREFTFSECDFSEQKLGESFRMGRWQMVQNNRWKYIRYLNYERVGAPIEELFDLESDPAELINLVHDASYEKMLKWCRDRRDYLLDHTPFAQTSWAPIRR